MNFFWFCKADWLHPGPTF